MKLKSNARQSKWFTFVLYPENNAHMEILNFLLDEKIQDMQEFSVAGMVHDRCVYLEGENKGKKKKSHVHVILKTKERHTPSAIAKMMGGQRIVFRLYQRDENQEHDTKVNRPKNEEFERHFYASTGKEYPVLIDIGYDEKQPVDIEISSEIWANLKSGKIGNWNSLPEMYYDNPEYPQFKCKKNQYWKIIRTQDINHVEIISDPKAYYLYLQHRDLASLRAGKVGYAEHEFFGSSELLEEMRGNRSLKYQLTQLIEYFESCGVTNGKQAYESLIYGNCTEEMLDFYWRNVSKFYGYFRSFENENVSCGTCSSETRSRERKEYYAEEYKQTAGKLRNEYKLIIDAIRQTKKATPEQTARLQDIAHWFSMHPEQTLFLCPPIEEQKMNAEIKEVMREKYALSDAEDASEPAPVLIPDDDCYPLIE